MIQKYGFVYIWFDSKYKKYYIGSHWGTENDGYVCSSNWMRMAYKRHSQFFKRRIIKRIFTNRKDTYLEESKYLKLIKDEELGKRYYNITKIIKQIDLVAWNSGKKGLQVAWNKGKECSEETKKKISESLKKRGPVSEETKQKLREKNLGKKLSAEHIQKIQKSRQWYYDQGISEDTKEKIKNTQFGKGTIPWNKGKSMSDETKRKISESKRNKYLKNKD